MPDVTVRGTEQLYRALQEFPVKFEKNVSRNALRAGMKVVQTEAVQLARKASGEYAKGLKISTRVRNGWAVAKLKSTGPHAYVGKWLEFGTKAHHIVAKKAKALSFGGIFRKSVDKGSKAYPHMRPALDGKAAAAFWATAMYVKNALSTKGGVDTSGIDVWVDEGDSR